MDSTWNSENADFQVSADAAWESNFYADDSTQRNSSAVEANNIASNTKNERIWHEGNVNIVRYAPAPPYPTCDDQDLMRKYPRPDVMFSAFYPASETTHELSANNFKAKFKDLLFTEENAQQKYISCYNTGCISACKHRLEIYFSDKLSINGQHFEGVGGQRGLQERTSTTGELFGTIRVRIPVKPDTPWGRLMGREVTAALVGPMNCAPTVFETRVVHREELSITLMCPLAFVDAFCLSAGETRAFVVQFTLDRVGFVHQLESVERQEGSNINRLFPTSAVIDNIDTLLKTHQKHIDTATCLSNMKQSLNLLQKLVIKTFMSLDLLEEQVGKCLYTPPLLVVGPFGTGKTHTLAECVRQLLYAENSGKPKAANISHNCLNHQRPTRILVCTNSNSAADLYMLNFMPDIESIRPYRVYALSRYITDAMIQYIKYTNFDSKTSEFVAPTYEALQNVRVVVTTLNAASLLCASSSVSAPTTPSPSSLPEGFFSHIIIDEAAQITEPSCIVPLRLATGATKILLAGDPLQSSPRVYSEFSQEQGLGKSLLERLYDSYRKWQYAGNDAVSSARRSRQPQKPPQQNPLVVVLSSNYRSHRDICQLMSNLYYRKYYGRDVVAANAKEVLPHPEFAPLTFVPCSDDAVDTLTNGSYFNRREAELVCETVQKILDDWPTSAWGAADASQVAVVTPYMEQVKGVRSMLRKRSLGSVTVESVNNVQGRQFRAIVMSCVRTQTTLKYMPYELLKEENTDLGYLSDHRMINTVITRAQSLVCVVGKAVDMLTYGRCREAWSKFLEMCVHNDDDNGTRYSAEDFARDSAQATKLRQKLGRKTQWNTAAAEFTPAAQNSVEKDAMTAKPLNPGEEMMQNNSSDNNAAQYVPQVLRDNLQYAQCREQQLQPPPMMIPPMSALRAAGMPTTVSTPVQAQPMLATNGHHHVMPPPQVGLRARPPQMQLSASATVAAANHDAAFQRAFYESAFMHHYSIFTSNVPNNLPFAMPPMMNMVMPPVAPLRIPQNPYYPPAYAGYPMPLMPFNTQPPPAVAAVVHRPVFRQQSMPPVMPHASAAAAAALLQMNTCAEPQQQQQQRVNSNGTAAAATGTEVDFPELGKVTFESKLSSVQRSVMDNNSKQGESAECMCAYCGAPLRLVNAIAHLAKTHKTVYSKLKKEQKLRSSTPPTLFLGYPSTIT